MALGNQYRRASRRVSTFVAPKASSLMRRVHGMTFQGFPAGLGTSTVFVLLANVDGHPAFLTNIEIIFFILAILIFSINILMLTAQAIIFPKRAWRNLTDPATNTFVTTSVLSFATLIVGTINYAVPAGATVDEIVVFWWIYIVLSLFVTVTVLLFWFWKPHNPAQNMTPAWAFPIFPLLLCGIVTINVLRVVPPEDPRAVTILAVGMMYFGAGSLISFLYLAVFMLRIMTTGFMDGHQANGAFVAAGPPGFSAIVIMTISRQASKILPAADIITPNAGEIWEAGSIFIGLMLTGLSLLLFLMAAFPYWFKLHKHIHECLGLWATTFPNVGLILSLKFLGGVFSSRWLINISTGLTVLLLITYVVVMTVNIIGVYKGLVLMSSDKDVYADSVGLDPALLGPKDDIEKGHGHGHGHH